jgi:uncharacterized protein YdaU (DUF1376 family)
MAALPYMQLYVADYLADTAHLNAAQHGAYLLLLMNYWQRGKALRNDNGRLANVARMSNEEWNVNREVLEEFFEVTDEEWIHHRVEKDLEAVRSKSEKASAAGRASAKRKLNKRSTNVPTNVEQTFNHTDTDTDTEQKKPSRGKREVEPRFSDFKKACDAYYRHKGFEMTWDGSEGKQLSSLLASNPTLNLEQFQGILRNRSRSAVVHSERPRKWLGNATDYAAGPLDKFGKPQEVGDARTGNRNTSKSGQVLDDLRRSLEEDGYSLGFGEAGDTQAGEPRQGDDGHLRSGPNGDGGSGRSLGAGITLLSPAS